jgi:mannose-6-phosphate isomerase-like protein (cupin superfamily)
VTEGELPEGAYRASIANADLINEPTNSATVRPLARAAEGPSSISVTWVSIDGRHQELASRRSARLYYVLGGDLTFVLDGRRPTALAAGELLVIPKGCPYYLEGTATYLVLNTPAFEAGDDVYRDDPAPDGSAR